MPDEALAQTLGLDNQKCKDTLTKLLTYGVAKVEDETGIIYCSRMVRDEKLRVIRKKAGEKGGNPTLLNQKSTTQVKQKSTPSSSSSSSSSSSKDLKHMVYSEAFDKLWLEIPKRDGNNPKAKAYESYSARLSDGSTTESEALNQVIAYRLWCENKGIIGLETVMQMASFFGPKSRGFENDWSIRENKNKETSKFQEKRSVVDQWLEKGKNGDYEGAVRDGVKGFL